MQIIAVKDMKAGFYLNPSFQPSVAAAIRGFSTIANEKNNAVSDFPHDFRLHHLGAIDIHTGEISVLKQPADLGSAADFKHSAQQNSLPFRSSAD